MVLGFVPVLKGKNVRMFEVLGYPDVVQGQFLLDFGVTFEEEKTNGFLFAALLSRLC